jgi:hypothetical protein
MLLFLITNPFIFKFETHHVIYIMMGLCCLTTLVLLYSTHDTAAITKACQLTSMNSSVSLATMQTECYIPMHEMGLAP